MRRFIVSTVIAVLVLGVAIPAEATHQKLVPSSFGAKTTANWKAQEGQPDTAGTANEALLLQKESATAENAFATATIFPGGPAAQLIGPTQGLEWERRADGRCGSTSPRWELGVRLPSTGQFERVVLPGCAFAVHSAGSAPGWIRDTYPGPVIGAAIAAAFFPTPVTNAQVTFLQIRYDEGPDTLAVPPSTFVFLDNIKITTEVAVLLWTYAGDNASSR